MADENTEVVQTSQDAPPAQGSESNPPAAPETSDPGTQGSEEQPEHSSNPQEGNPEDQAGQDNKPSRVEKRINTLLSKLKENNSPSTPENRKAQPYFTQEEINNGEIDPTTFEKRVQDRVQFEVHQALERERINTQYTSAVREHEADLESVKDLDPNVERMAVEQYEALNYQINPLTGKRMFIPAVKMTEIVKRISDHLERVADGIVEGNRQYTASVSQNQAVPTGGTIKSSKARSDTTDFTEFEKNFGSRV